MKTLLIAALLFNATTVADMEVAGVKFTGTLVKNNYHFVLNGAGVKTRWFLDLYTAGLYLTKKSKDPHYIQNCECPIALKIVITSSWVSAKTFRSAVDDWFHKSMNGNVAPIKSRIETFKDSFGKDINIYDEVLMVYHPKEGIRIYKNGVYKNSIPGLDFKRELAKLWLGDNPVSLELKNGLLGIQ